MESSNCSVAAAATESSVRQTLKAAQRHGVSTGRSGKPFHFYSNPHGGATYWVPGCTRKHTFQVPFSLVMRLRKCKLSAGAMEVSQSHVGATQAASSCLVSEKPKELEWLLLPLVLTVTFPEGGSPWQEQLNKLVPVSECLPFTVWEVKMKIKWCMLKCWAVNGDTVEKDTWPVHLPLLRAV